ncbi:hypothetical protein D3C83_177300 [compost metagenome]
MHGVDPLAAADADPAELLLPVAPDDAVDVFSALEGRRGIRTLQLRFAHRLSRDD